MKAMTSSPLTLCKCACARVCVCVGQKPLLVLTKMAANTLIHGMI